MSNLSWIPNFEAPLLYYALSLTKQIKSSNNFTLSCVILLLATYSDYNFTASKWRNAFNASTILRRYRVIGVVLCRQASSMPTVVVYVMDTARNVSPVTFMSNMLYACSILYKTKLPFIIVMNKVSDDSLLMSNMPYTCSILYKIKLPFIIVIIRSVN